MKTVGRPSAVAQSNAPVGSESDFEEMPMGVVGSQAMRRTGNQHATAIQVQVPRKIDVILAKVVEEFELGGEEMFWTWEVNDKQSPTGKTWIEGCAIGGAMVMLRHYGNAVVQTDPVEEGPLHWVFSSTFIDLESGVNFNRLFRQRKPKESNYNADRALDMEYQKGQSKSIRNVVLNVMPDWLKKKAMEAAKRGAEKDMASPEVAMKNTLKAFALLNVTTEAIEWKIGKAIAAFEKSDVVRVRGLYRAMFEGQTSVVAEFGEFFEAQRKAATDAAAAKAAEGAVAADPPTAGADSPATSAASPTPAQPQAETKPAAPETKASPAETKAEPAATTPPLGETKAMAPNADTAKAEPAKKDGKKQPPPHPDDDGR